VWTPGECLSNFNFVNIVALNACDLETLGRVEQIDRITDIDLKVAGGGD
jgi:hypothetical protein